MNRVTGGIGRRPLGATGLATAPLIFGGNVFGWTVDKAASMSLLDAFIDGGGNVVDTADMYSRWVPGNEGGESETIIGEWLARGARDRVVLATKVGMASALGGASLSRAHIVASVEGSLRRLRTDHIDLYQSHVDDAATPLEETLEAHAALVRAGKVRFIGASNFSAARLEASLAISRDRGLPRYGTLQPLYNLFDRAAFEDDLQALCVREGVGAITYSSLASGFLTGKYATRSAAEASPRAKALAAYFTPRGQRIINRLSAIARRCERTPAQVALAWLVGRAGVSAAIVSATSVAQLQSLMAVIDFTLPADAVHELDRCSAPETA